MNKEVKEIISSSIASQIKELDEELKDKSNFIKRKEWKKLSVLKEGEEENENS